MEDETEKPIRRRTFVNTGEAWYRGTAMDNGVVDDLNIMVSERPNDGVLYEFSIKWRMLNGQAIPKVEVFEDAWMAFSELPDLFAWLAAQHDKCPPPADVVAALLELGFVDETDRIGPKVRDDISRVAAVVSETIGNEAVGEAMLHRDPPMGWCSACGTWRDFKTISTDAANWDSCRTCGSEVSEVDEVPDEAVEAALRLLVQEKP
jgi:hypothetical protein